MQVFKKKEFYESLPEIACVFLLCASHRNTRPGTTVSPTPAFAESATVAAKPPLSPSRSRRWDRRRAPSSHYLPPLYSDDLHPLAAVRRICRLQAAIAFSHPLLLRPPSSGSGGCKWDGIRTPWGFVLSTCCQSSPSSTFLIAWRRFWYRSSSESKAIPGLHLKIPPSEKESDKMPLALVSYTALLEPTTAKMTLTRLHKRRQM